MKLISKIEINYYRSFKVTIIKNINELNIFSGKNDSGKSNVIRALELFFDKYSCTFYNDYNKDRAAEVKNESIKGKQTITIAVTFETPSGFKSLPNRVRLSRTWDRRGQLVNEHDNLEKLLKNDLKKIKTARRGLTTLLNKIKYINIPAVRDEAFFSQLLLLLQEELFDAESRKRIVGEGGIKKCAKSFNTEISRLTSRINEDFKTTAGIDSYLSLPTELSELFRALQIDTKQGDYDIPISLRGHGIKMRYIPTILNHISSIYRLYYIWGFDEPENSCEYALSKSLAYDFQNKYSKHAQIFVVSHSFSFISLEKPNVSKYRVYKKDNEDNSSLLQVEEGTKHELEKELGFLELNDSLNKTYESLLSKMAEIDKIEAVVNKSRLPFIFLEGESDNINFQTAYSKLFNDDIFNCYNLGNHTSSMDGPAIGGGGNAFKSIYL